MTRNVGIANIQKLEGSKYCFKMYDISIESLFVFEKKNTNLLSLVNVHGNIT